MGQYESANNSPFHNIKLKNTISKSRSRVSAKVIKSLYDIYWGGLNHQGLVFILVVSPNVILSSVANIEYCANGFWYKRAICDWRPRKKANLSPFFSFFFRHILSDKLYLLSLQSGWKSLKKVSYFGKTTAYGWKVLPDISIANCTKVDRKFQNCFCWYETFLGIFKHCVLRIVSLLGYNITMIIAL